MSDEYPGGKLVRSQPGFDILASMQRMSRHLLEGAGRGMR
jgi:hypothetical protein